jgi:hypothetical protein
MPLYYVQLVVVVETQGRGMSHVHMGHNETGTIVHTNLFNFTPIETQYS